MMDEYTKSLTPFEEVWPEVFRGLEELIAFHNEAAMDVTEVIKALGEHPQSQFLRRIAVRNFAAHVEGIVFLIKQYTIALSNVRTVDLSKKELAQLAESDSYLDENGQQKQLRHLGFFDNFKFSLKTYARVGGFTFDLECSDSRYEYFLEMIGVRDRLMHPKSVRSLIVLDDEFLRIGKAWTWYQEQIGRLLGNPTSTVGLRTRFTR